MSFLLSYPLSRSERRRLAEACETVLRGANTEPAPSLEHAIRAHIEQEGSLPQLRALLDEFMSGKTQPVLLLSGLPTAEDHTATIVAIAALMGELALFPGEGDYVIQIRERIGARSGQRASFENSREFFPHTDLTYAPEVPEVLLLHAISNSHESGGLSQFCLVDDVVRRLDGESLNQLQLPQFEFPAPAHYQGLASRRSPILRRNADGVWRIRFRRDGVTTRTKAGIEAIASLVTAILDGVIEIPLLPGHLAAFDNSRALHGRTGFVAPSAGVNRHINRAYVARRPADRVQA